MLSNLKAYLNKNLVIYALLEGIRETIKHCLEDNRGLGCVYYTVLESDDNLEVCNIGPEEDNGTDYYAIINHSKRIYFIIQDNVIVWQGNYRSNENGLRIALRDFTTFRHITRAVELMSKGLWFEAKHHIYEYCDDIMIEMAAMDTMGSATAHTLRVNVGF